MSTIEMGKRSSNSRGAITSALATAKEADAAWLRDELALAWRSAQDDAVAAYRAWCESPGQTAYVVYRAAQDRADQAQDVLASGAV